jgi:transposase-like protein
MPRRKRRNHRPEFKAKVAFEALKGEQTIAEIADKYELHTNQVTTWKAKLKKDIATVFETEDKKQALDPTEDVAALQAKIGKLSMELDWLKKKSKDWF